MKYKEIIKIIAEKEGVSTRQIEAEMSKALTEAGIASTPKDFIKKMSTEAKSRLYIIR